MSDLQHHFWSDEVTRAYVSGDRVVAFCGHEWIPAHDPDRFPKAPRLRSWCPTCLEDLHMDGLKVVVLACYRPSAEDRARLWEFTQGWWRNDQPNWPIVTAPGPLVGPFNRSAALNEAAEKAGDWDVALFVDTDTLIDPHAARAAVEIAYATNTMVLAGDERVMLTREGTSRILQGYNGNWRVPGIQERVYTDGCSSCVVVSRSLWDEVGGFDEHFVGWGWEDTCFRVVCETVSGKPMVKLSSAMFHLWHVTSHENDARRATYQANKARFDLYKAAHWDRERIEPLLAEARAVRTRRVVEEPMIELPPSRIPRILFRTVPLETSDRVEHWWTHAQQLHPGWEFITYREPLDPTEWPLTGDLWTLCQNGAQKAGLIRLEALMRHGGVYFDSDIEPVRSLEPLLGVPAFAAWEDARCVPDFILAAEPGHPAFQKCLDEARAAMLAGADAWHSGPGITTSVLPDRHDVLLLPPGSFSPQHYLDKDGTTSVEGPWVFARHRFHGSWLNAQQRAEIERRAARQAEKAERRSSRR